jgi:predicted ArsR family transcriptional regulator
MMDGMGKGGSDARDQRLGPTRAEVLHHLRNAGQPLPVAEISDAIGLHPNTTRFHLDSMVASGLVTKTVQERSQPGRPKLLYASVAGHRIDPYHDLAVAMVRHFAGRLPDRVGHARTAGRAWGDQLRAERDPAGSQAPVERLISVMTDLGYEADFVSSPSAAVVLRPCPFLDLVSTDAETICELHFGLASGLLGPNPEWRVTGIEPLASPTSCLIHLTALRPGAADVSREEQPDA